MLKKFILSCFIFSLFIAVIPSNIEASTKKEIKNNRDNLIANNNYNNNDNDTYINFSDLEMVHPGLFSAINKTQNYLYMENDKLKTTISLDNLKTICQLNNNEYNAIRFLLNNKRPNSFISIRNGEICITYGDLTNIVGTAGASMGSIAALLAAISAIPGGAAIIASVGIGSVITFGSVVGYALATKQGIGISVHHRIRYFKGKHPGRG